MINKQLTPQQATRFIGTYLARNNYDSVFPNDIGLLLAENRRITRIPNVIKYGRIPFSKDSKGRISYRLEDIQDLCNNSIKPICANKLAVKLARASGLGYYTPYSSETANDDRPVVSDAMLNRLLAELDAPDPLDKLLNELDGELV